MGQCLITRKGITSNLSFESNAKNSFGTVNFTLQQAYKKCLVITSCVRQRDVNRNLSASVSNGELTLLKSVRPDVSVDYNMVVYTDIYLGENISGTLTINGGYGMGYTIVYI